MRKYEKETLRKKNDYSGKNMKKKVRRVMMKEEEEDEVVEDDEVGGRG